jgi:hypothetical protein
MRDLNDMSGCLDLFDLLSHDNRIIVLSDPTDRILYTWNRESTLQVWEEVETFRHGHRVWKEWQAQTLSSVPQTFEAARKAAIAWKNT